MGQQDTKRSINITGARVHNLKNIDIQIPHDQLVVFTGLSGSGKSTLAFDTIFAEGQRRYVESLSSYARQFLGRIEKPDVDSITGIAPAIAIEQKVNTRNPRSTVGTTTEIYDYLKLLFSRIGTTYSPVSGKEVRVDYVSDIVNYIFSLPGGSRVLVTAPLDTGTPGFIEKLTLLFSEGFQRLYTEGKVVTIEEYLPTLSGRSEYGKVNLVVDRLAVRDDDDLRTRVADSVVKSYSVGDGLCEIVMQGDNDQVAAFSNRFEADGIKFEQPNEHLFSFNNPLGACPRCEGYGKVIGIDEDLVIPDKSKSVYDNAIACWRGETMGLWKEELIRNAHKFDFPIHKPYYDLTREEKLLLWSGNRYFKGLDEFFSYLESERYKIQYRVMLSRYKGKTLCPDCSGSRLRKEALYVKVGGLTIADMVAMPVAGLLDFFNGLKTDKTTGITAERILLELRNRLTYLVDVGLGYLTLDRLSSTLSGGESQRINLSTSLGSNLTGSLYILDEPSIGLHPRDTRNLITVLRKLRDLGNTVIVVEHEEEIIRAADRIVDIGPRAGYNGGEIVYNGDIKGLVKAKNSLTADYLTGKKEIKKPDHHHGWSNYIEIKGARENNLKGINVKVPLGAMTCITGVSGSGKSSLVQGILYPALRRELLETGMKPGNFEGLAGDISMLKSVEMIDQNPIGKSSRSNPVTYIKAWDEIRKIFADQQYARMNSLTPAHFSFNIAGGRCEECQGEGVIKVEMQFMADVELKCERCGGRRFRDDILEVRYNGHTIYDVLEMTVDQSVEFFGKDKGQVSRKLVEKLKTLQDVGLGYVKLGQSSSTLSGGESQRVKLASFLMKENTDGHMMFIFDEPTTGLHFHDINKLLASFDALIKKGHTVVIVEHNMDVIKCADWVVDLGPDAGSEGGRLVFQGTPEDLVKCGESLTGKYLAEKIQA